VRCQQNISIAAPAFEVLHSQQINLCAVELDPLGHLMPGDAMGYIALSFSILSTLAAADPSCRRDISPILSDLALTSMGAIETLEGLEKEELPLSHLFTAAWSRFCFNHASGPHHLSCTKPQGMVPPSTRDPHHLTDAVTTADAMRATILALEVSLTSPPAGSPGSRRHKASGKAQTAVAAAKARRERRKMHKVRKEVVLGMRRQLSAGGARAQQAVSLLSSLMLESPTVADACCSLGIPDLVGRILRSTVSELKAASTSQRESGVGGLRTTPPPSRVAAVCVQFFLRLASEPLNGRPALKEAVGSKAHLIAGNAAPGKHASGVACVQYLIPSLLFLLGGKYGAAQQLSAELLRLFVSERPARMMMRNMQAEDTLLAAVNCGLDQVQYSAVETLKVLWAAQEGAPLIIPDFY
jgi:hypothetical protein